MSEPYLGLQSPMPWAPTHFFDIILYNCPLFTDLLWLYRSFSVFWILKAHLHLKAFVVSLAAIFFPWSSVTSLLFRSLFKSLHGKYKVWGTTVSSSTTVFGLSSLHTPQFFLAISFPPSFLLPLLFLPSCHPLSLPSIHIDCFSPPCNRYLLFLFYLCS